MERVVRDYCELFNGICSNLSIKGIFLLPFYWLGFIHFDLTVMSCLLLCLVSSTHRQHMSPLLSSLSCLVVYLRRQQHLSFLSLTRSPHSAEAWRLLCHSSLSLLILYNRHRECEVAKLTIQDYRSRITPQSSSSVGPPSGMESLLSPFERQVLGDLPRAGVLGKRGRVQPLILPPQCESCLDLLLRTSPNVGVDPESPYVFSRPYHSPATPLRGTDLLRNLARTSGAKNPVSLTATRVRRQVAILTQLLLLDEGEGQGAAIKRLEDFLEREYHVTQNCSAIIRDPALMGRVGRVVLYGEREGVLFRGMSLQDICLELDGKEVHQTFCFYNVFVNSGNKLEILDDSHCTVHLNPCFSDVFHNHSIINSLSSLDSVKTRDKGNVWIIQQSR